MPSVIRKKSSKNYLTENTYYTSTLGSARVFPYAHAAEKIASANEEVIEVVITLKEGAEEGVQGYEGSTGTGASSDSGSAVRNRRGARRVLAKV